MKSKTLAAWLALVGGPLGLHRFYLHGWGDLLGWALPIPTALGIYGLQRVQEFGQDDQLSWLLVPLLGFTFAGCCLAAIVYGLTTREAWNARYNRGEDVAAGGTRWSTILAMIAALMIGAGVLMASIAFSFQRYFEHQIEEGRRISQ